MNKKYKKRYQEYLQTDTWRELRRQRMSLDDNKCLLCDSEANEVHHRKYPKTLGTETVKDLVSLCRSCHGKFHNIEEEESEWVGDTFYNANVFGVCVKTNCPQGGDAGHGGITVMRLFDYGGTSWKAIWLDDKCESLEICLSGDSECEGFIQALEFAAYNLRRQFDKNCREGE